MSSTARQLYCWGDSAWLMTQSIIAWYRGSQSTRSAGPHNVACIAKYSKPGLTYLAISYVIQVHCKLGKWKIRLSKTLLRPFWGWSYGFFSQGIARVPMCWFSSTIHGCFLAFWRLYRIYCCTITGPRTKKCVKTSFYNVGWLAYCWVELCDRLAVCVCLRSCSLVIIWPNCLTWKL